MSFMEVTDNVETTLNTLFGINLMDKMERDKDRGVAFVAAFGVHCRLERLHGLTYALLSPHTISCVKLQIWDGSKV